MVYHKKCRTNNITSQTVIDSFAKQTCHELSSRFDDFESDSETIAGLSKLIELITTVEAQKHDQRKKHLKGE